MSNLKNKLKERQKTVGSWLTIGHQSIAEIMAATDFEWPTIDMEHSVIDLPTAQQLLPAIKSFDKEVLVRVPANEEVVIKRVMDAGVDGIIVPMVNSKALAIQAVGFAKYPPIGKRGVGLARAQGYGCTFEEYEAWQRDSAVVIAQIEHIDAVNNLEEIIAVEGIDGIIIGPYDLSASMGYPGEYNRDDVKDAIKKVEHICLENKISLGFHVIEPDVNLLNEKLNDGYNFVAFSIDFLFLGRKIDQELKEVLR